MANEVTGVEEVCKNCISWDTTSVTPGPGQEQEGFCIFRVLQLWKTKWPGWHSCHHGGFSPKPEVVSSGCVHP